MTISNITLSLKYQLETTYCKAIMIFYTLPGRESWLTFISIASNHVLTPYFLSILENFYSDYGEANSFTTTVVAVVASAVGLSFIILAACLIRCRFRKKDHSQGPQDDQPRHSVVHRYVSKLLVIFGEYDSYIQIFISMIATIK